MSNVGDALSGGGSDASGISDTTLSDASLGDQMAGGTGDLGTGDPSAFSDAGRGTGSFNSLPKYTTSPLIKSISLVLPRMILCKIDPYNGSLLKVVNVLLMIASACSIGILTRP